MANKAHIVWLLLAFPVVAAAASIQAGDFTGPTTIFTFDDLLIWGSRVAPKTYAGITYSTDDNVLRAIETPPNTSFCVTGRCIGQNSFGGFIDATFGFSVSMVGLYVGGASVERGASSYGTATISFFDEVGTLLSTLDVANTSLPVFTGWHNTSGQIGRVRIQNTNGPEVYTITTIDNITVAGTFDTASNDTLESPIESPIPEPSTLIAGGLAAVMAAARRPFGGYVWAKARSIVTHERTRGQHSNS